MDENVGNCLKFHVYLFLCFFSISKSTKEPPSLEQRPRTNTYPPQTSLQRCVSPVPRIPRGSATTEKIPVTTWTENVRQWNHCLISSLRYVYFVCRTWSSLHNVAHICEHVGSCTIFSCWISNCTGFIKSHLKLNIHMLGQIVHFIRRSYLYI